MTWPQIIRLAAYLNPHVAVVVMVLLLFSERTGLVDAERFVRPLKTRLLGPNSTMRSQEQWK